MQIQVLSIISVKDGKSVDLNLVQEVLEDDLQGTMCMDGFENCKVVSVQILPETEDN
jgi:uncharacterized protein (DUF2344 family)